MAFALVGGAVMMPASPIPAHPSSARFLQESRAFAERRRTAMKFAGGVGDGLSLNRPMPVREVGPGGPRDPRPIAFGREPCRRCQARGDVGCEHQQPCTAGTVPQRTAPNSPRPWSAQEDRQLFELCGQGRSIYAIGQIVGRAASSVNSRINLLAREAGKRA